MGGGGVKAKGARACTGGGGTGQACCGVAGGRATIAPFTAHAFSVFVFFKGTSGGGISSTGGAEHLAFLLAVGLTEGVCVSSFGGTERTIITGLAFLEGRGKGGAVGLLTLLGDDAVVDTVSALIGDTDLSTHMCV